MSHILVMNMAASTSHIPYYVLRKRLDCSVVLQDTIRTSRMTNGNGQVHRLRASLNLTHSEGDICVWLIRWVIDDITKCVDHVESRTGNICPIPRPRNVNSNKCSDNRPPYCGSPPPDPACINPWPIPLHSSCTIVPSYHSTLGGLWPSELIRCR